MEPKRSKIWDRLNSVLFANSPLNINKSRFTNPFNSSRMNEAVAIFNTSCIMRAKYPFSLELGARFYVRKRFLIYQMSHSLEYIRFFFCKGLNDKIFFSEPQFFSSSPTKLLNLFSHKIDKISLAYSSLNVWSFKYFCSFLTQKFLCSYPLRSGRATALFTRVCKCLAFRNRRVDYVLC